MAVEYRQLRNSVLVFGRESDEQPLCVALRKPETLSRPIPNDERQLRDRLNVPYGALFLRREENGELEPLGNGNGEMVDDWYSIDLQLTYQDRHIYVRIAEQGGK